MPWQSSWREAWHVSRGSRGLKMKRIKLTGLACEFAIAAALGSVATAATAQDVPPAESNPASAQAPLSDPSDLQERAQAPTPATNASSDATDRLRVQVGIMPRFIDNYFQSEDAFNASTAAVPKKNAHLITFSAGLSYDLVKTADSALTANVRVRPNFFSNLKGADSTDLDASLAYRWGPNQFTLGYFGTPRRLSSVSSGVNIYGETEGFDAEYVRTLSKRWRARASYQFSRETFSAFTERDLSLHQFRSDVRYKLTPLFMPSVGFEYRRANAGSDNFSYKRPALLLSVTSEVGRVAYMNFRYRYSDREYLTDLPTDSNFGREDHRHEFNFYGTFQLGHGFSIFAFANHTTNHSTSATHVFKAKDGGLGLFYQF